MKSFGDGVKIFIDECLSTAETIFCKVKRVKSAGVCILYKNSRFGYFYGIRAVNKTSVIHIHLISRKPSSKVKWLIQPFNLQSIPRLFQYLPVEHSEVYFRG
jgi:hypothetical protein